VHFSSVRLVSFSFAPLPQELVAINRSLTALGNVIKALSKNEAHIPYREHKLTMLLSDSLGRQHGGQSGRGTL